MTRLHYWISSTKVWDVVQNDLEPLRSAVEKILADEAPSIQEPAGDSQA
ncbi:MAG: hypothetical protein ACYC7E_22270 [Armatimonadota bacterium]